MNELTVGIYVPSYRRSNAIHTYNLVTCTYVVRESERELYEKAGIERLISVRDDLIDSDTKVRQWIIDNAKEDVVVQMDDDIKSVLYRMDNTKEITDREVIEDEIARIAQLVVDLGIGFAGTTVTTKPWNYTQEFSFKGLVGGIYWINKAKYKFKMDEKANLKNDVDKVLYELLHNRIILMPRYICVQAQVDTNSGGNSGIKSKAKIHECNEYMKMKWGSYYDFDYKKNTAKINVKR